MVRRHVHRGGKRGGDGGLKLMDYSKLNNICHAKIESFSTYGEWNEKGRYFFKDNGADVLAVAHLDTVVPCTHVKKILLPHDTLIYTPVLDDRLGVYVILDLLPKLGIKCDILLTVDEEIGKSTGVAFEPPKQYNWMFQFDRAGTDVVMYDYETPEEMSNLKKHGFFVGSGTFSDISSMEHLHCVGYNFGVGYHEQHSLNSWASMNEMFKMVGMFKSFYEKDKDTPKPHTPIERAWKSYHDSRYEYLQRGDAYITPEGVHRFGTSTNDWIQCVICGKNVFEDDIWTARQFDAFDEECCEECYDKLVKAS